MKISDTALALMVLRGDLRAYTNEKVAAVNWLKENGIFSRLPDDLQEAGEAILDAALEDTP